MSHQRYYDLTQCTEFRQTLQSRPPAIIHGTALLIVALIGGAVVWAACTEADLIVRAQGRVRPLVRSQRLADAAAEESSVSPSRDGRVVAVHVRDGDKVQRGQALAQLDTQRLDNDIASRQRTIEAAESELASLERTETLVTERFQAARAKAEAELAQAEREIAATRKRRDAEIRQRTAALQAASKTFDRLEKLHQQKAVASAERDDAQAKLQEATVLLEKASLPVDDGRLPVLRQALELVGKDYEVEVSKIAAQRQVKRQQLQAARLELANLQLELRQSVLRAPLDGTVTSVKARVGEMVQTGQPLLSLAELDGYRMDVAVASDDVGHLQEGLPVRIKMDAYDYQKYGTLTGKIIFISPDSRLPSDGSPARPQYLVKVSLDSQQVSRGGHVGRIKLGMTGAAEIITDRESLLSLLFRSLRRRVSLG